MAARSRTAASTTSRPKKPKAPVIEPRLLSVPQAAAALGISTRTLGKWAIAGMVPSLKVKGRRLFSVAALDRWIEQQSA